MYGVPLPASGLLQRDLAGHGVAQAGKQGRVDINLPSSLLRSTSP